MDALRRRQRAEQAEPISVSIELARPSKPVTKRKRPVMPTPCSSSSSSSASSDSDSPPVRPVQPRVAPAPASTSTHTNNPATAKLAKTINPATDVVNAAKKARRDEKGKGREVDPIEASPRAAASTPAASASTSRRNLPPRQAETSTSSAERALSSLKGLIKRKPVKPAKPAVFKKPSSVAPKPAKKSAVKAVPSSTASSSKASKPVQDESMSDMDFVAAHFRDASYEPEEAPPTPMRQISEEPEMPKAVVKAVVKKEKASRIDTEADHQAILSGQWINAVQLNKLADEIGLQFKKGAFSTTESEALKKALAQYKQVHRLDDDEITEIVYAKGKKARAEHSTFFSEITSHIPGRPIISVYHHLRRLYHPLKGQGRWTQAQDDALQNAVTTMGPSWELIEPLVGRSAFDCRDRYRNHIEHKASNLQGPWSAEEERELVDVVLAQQIATGVDESDDVMWGAVAEKMGHKRSRTQCRQKWFDTLGMQAHKAGQLTPTWSAVDTYLLVQKIKSMDVPREEDVNFNKLRDADWNFWPGKILKAKWNSLKDQLIAAHDQRPHPEVVDMLVERCHRPKDAQLAPGASLPRPGRRN